MFKKCGDSQALARERQRVVRAVINTHSGDEATVVVRR